MKITLKGDVREFEAPKTALEIAASLSQALKKEALAVKVDGEVQGLTTVIDRDCALEFLTFADEEGRRVYRHTASHVMAQAVKALWPEAKLAIGCLLYTSRRAPDAGGARPRHGRAVDRRLPHPAGRVTPLTLTFFRRNRNAVQRRPFAD